MSEHAPLGGGGERGHGPPSRRDVLRAWAPAVAYMGLIFGLSSMHLQAQIIEQLPFRDKLVHTIEYAVLGGLCAYATRRTWPLHAALRTSLLGAFLAVAFGVSDEIHQSFVPGRNADVNDILADVLGASLGVLVAAYWERRHTR
ncbi:MAG: VanZ family protein [Polyangiales bacterium]|nr:VanZ family protein [Myxococcales bacterium]MCB9657302.1 VanZ family protein [Sandaracinaceae bacterium]